MTVDRPIGGFIEFEQRKGKSYHAGAISFDTARSALRAQIRALQDQADFDTILIPYFTCPDVEIVLTEELGPRSIKRYALGENLLPKHSAAPEAILLYYNVFGLLGSHQVPAASRAIVDNAHAFFAAPHRQWPTIFSARKFFGVPDGAYLYTDLDVPVPAERASAQGHIRHLLSRLEEGPEAAYSQYVASELSFASAPPKGMSRLAEAMLGGLNYPEIKRTRLANFRILHQQLGEANELQAAIDLALEDPAFVPYSYPFLREGGEQVRRRLIERKLFVPLLWSEVADIKGVPNFETHLALDTVHLPVDQRYGPNDMNVILDRLRGSS